MRLILASASPRRRELLTQAGFVFEVRPAHVNEDVRAGEDAIAYVVRLAREKAQVVFDGMSGDGADSASHPFRTECEMDGAQGPGSCSPTLSAQDADWMGHPLIVLGADTTVTVDGQILAKPADAEDAARMLRLLRGRTHRVITGVAVVTAKGAEVAAEVTGVRFATLSDEEIAAYVATGEPMDKAGAYAIQGLAGKWIPRVEGCYFNVVGLPLALVTTMLEGVGVRSAA
ncbi:MAG TPA: Maf family protein [Terracidiphilus sp.]|nr:Maf family protein [Terracidiphilus sp.]